jgi:hypothetical protein
VGLFGNEIEAEYTGVFAKLLPAYVEIWQERECVARHERHFGRGEQVLDGPGTTGEVAP